MKYLWIAFFLVMCSTIHSQKIEAISNTPGEIVITAENTDITDFNSLGIEATGYYGIIGFAHGNYGVGIYGEAIGLSGHGVYGRANGISGHGVHGFANGSNGYAFYGESVENHCSYFRGEESSADIVLGGNDDSFDDGIIISDPDFNSSDIFLKAKDAIVMVISDRAAEDGTFEVWNRNNSDRVFVVEEDGDVIVKGTTVHSSDRNLKDQITEINQAEILKSLINMPLYKWQYKGQNEKHIGPMAQDFYAAFGLGRGETTIAAVDGDGVALVAIQAQQDIIADQQREIDALKLEIKELKKMMATFLHSQDIGLRNR